MNGLTKKDALAWAKSQLIDRSQPTRPLGDVINEVREMSNMTVTEAAIVDYERQKEAHMARAKNFDPVAVDRDPGDTSLSTEAVDALCSPVRLEISFEDPLRTRRQIEVVQAALVEALVVTQDHARGINRQRMDLRSVIKTTSEVLVYMSGRTPTGRKKLTPRSPS